MNTFTRIPINDKDFEKKYPGWNALINKVKEKVFSLKDVNKFTGLTKNQIAYFIKKDVLSGENEEYRKWRRFSLLDLFILSVAKKLRFKGLEVSSLKDGKVMVKDNHYTEPFVYILNGYDVFFYTDFEGVSGFVREDEERRSFLSEINIEITQKEFIGMDLLLNLTRGSTFFVGVSLKKVFRELAEKIDLPNFHVEIQADDKYNFVINNIPLHLESLGEDNSKKEVLNDAISNPQSNL